MNIGDEKNPDWGYIDKQGNWLIEPQYRTAFSFQENYAQVWINGLQKIINTQGEVVYESGPYMISDFHDGLAVISKEIKHKLIQSVRCCSCEGKGNSTNRTNVIIGYHLYRDGLGSTPLSYRIGRLLISG